MACQRRRLTRDTFHRATIAKDGVGVVGEEIEAWLVKLGSSVCLGNGKTDGIGETLAEWTSRDFNARSVTRFWMAGSDAVDLTEVLEIV